METEALIVETGARVVQRIRKPGHSDYYLALASGISYTTLVRRMKRPSGFEIGELTRLCVVLDTNLAALVSEESAI